MAIRERGYELEGTGMATRVRGHELKGRSMATRKEGVATRERGRELEGMGVATRERGRELEGRGVAALHSSEAAGLWSQGGPLPHFPALMCGLCVLLIAAEPQVICRLEEEIDAGWTVKAQDGTFVSSWSLITQHNRWWGVLYLSVCS